MRSKFTSGHDECEVPIRYPSGHESFQFKREFWAGWSSKENSELEIDIWQLAENRWHLELEWAQLAGLVHCADRCFKRGNLYAVRWSM